MRRVLQPEAHHCIGGSFYLAITAICSLVVGVDEDFVHISISDSVFCIITVVISNVEGRNSIDTEIVE